LTNAIPVWSARPSDERARPVLGSGRAPEFIGSGTGKLGSFDPTNLRLAVHGAAPKSGSSCARNKALADGSTAWPREGLMKLDPVPITMMASHAPGQLPTTALQCGNSNPINKNLAKEAPYDLV
jgi:hypothetical protein